MSMSSLTTTSKKKPTKITTQLPKLDKKAIADFLQQNPSVDLKKINTFHTKSLEALNWGNLDKEALLPQLQALQRLLRLTDNLEIAEALYEAGLHAAVQIAEIPLHKFVAQYAGLFIPNGLSSEEQAKKVHKRALARKSKALITYTALVQHKSVHYQATRFDNLSAATDANYNSLPSYQDLFGDLDFCTCPDCRSIFSPAAYFVDLMRLQDNYITKESNASPILLLDRRPDLWEIPLDCKHTNNIIPKLEIVNKVLLNALGQGVSYEKLITTKYPFNLPFHLPLTQIHLYLAKNQQNLPKIWQTLIPNATSPDTLPIPCQSLDLSPEQWALYSTPQTDSKVIASLYGLPEETPDPVSILTLVDTFLSQTGLSYLQLQELLQEDLSDQEIAKGLNNNFFINSNVSGLAKGPIAIDTKTDQLTNLTIERLDHINRFVRLAQALGWNFTDLDWALRIIGAIINTANQNIPVINDAALPYLVWMQNLRQAYPFSVNQICALLGTLKDVGQKNGATFFDQIFNNKNVLNPPIWKDSQDIYNLVWLVPSTNADFPVIQSSQDQQIQNALAAALHLSQADLFLVTNQVLQTLEIKNNELPLTLANLSILYRLSQLPALTGLGIEACFIALSLPGQPQEILKQLTGASGETVKDSLLLLQQFAQWLANTPFSVYQLQFILTGNSQDPTIQNQILGTDKIANFLNELQTAIQPTLLTQERFVRALSPTLQNLFGDQVEDLGTNLYQALQNTNYIDKQGIITAIGCTADTEAIENLIPIQIKLPSDSISKCQKVVTYILDILQTSYQLQQKALTQQLASLYNVSSAIVYALEVWGGLALGDLKTISIQILDKENPDAATALLQNLLSKSTEGWSKKTILLEDNQDVVSRLQLLQQYAILATSLGLSAAEIRAIVEHPEYFGISYNTNTPENSLSFNLKNIRSLYQFKQLVHELQDTENHLLDYFTFASTKIKTKKETETKNDLLAAISHRLAKVTRWDTNQILFLIEQLWSFSTGTDSLNVLPVYATVAGIDQLQAYFELTKQLNIDINSLYTFTQLNPTTTYAIYQALADSLWGGLQKQYHHQPEIVATLKGKVDESIRNALLGLVIYQLRTQKKLSITTARDLYEYLLIDVEVSSKVETSYVQEATLALQLYIYRCLNSLEEGIIIQEELYTWWPWLEHYRVWQANREVFLYPENYIQPELRLDKTPPFINLENALKQSNLTAGIVETAVKTYLDEFAEVATLEIVGSYLYAHDDKDPLSQRTLYLVGRTATKAYTYYYRNGTFSRDTVDKPYTPVQWTPWIKIDLQIKSTLATPVYAFNRLFLFWTEAKPGPTDKDDNGKTTHKRFEATLYYAFYDFNQRWSAPQQLSDPVLLPTDVNTLAAAEACPWQQIWASFDLASQQIYWYWGNAKTNPMLAGKLNKQLKIKRTMLPLFPPFLNGTNQVGAVVYQEKLYCFYQGPSGQIWYNIAENNTWQAACELLESKKYFTHNIVPSTSYTPVAISVTDILSCYFGGLDEFLWNINYNNNEWRGQSSFPKIKPSYTPSVIFYKGNTHVFYIGIKEDGWTTIYCSNIDKEIFNKDISADGHRGLSAVVSPDNKMYCFYQGQSENNSGLKSTGLKYSFAEDINSNWQQGTISGVTLYGTPSAIVFQDKLYCFYYESAAANSTGTLAYAVLESDGWHTYPTIYVDVNPITTNDLQPQPCVVEYQNELYCFYQATDNLMRCVPVLYNIHVSVIIADTANIQNVTNSQFLPSMHPWTIDLGPDGTQFLSIPIEGSDDKNEIRLNSLVALDLGPILFSEGIDGFLSIPTQLTPEINIDGTKTDTLDFAGANGMYYWEIFFHTPFLVAHTLSTQQQFSLAKKWYEYIFNPTISKNNWNLLDKEDPNDKYWRFLELRSQYNPNLQTELHEDWNQEVQQDVKDNLQLAAYHNDPFDPHAIARLRPIAYQKTIVMHYIDNLLDWADSLFRQYTAESIVEATMLYVMAYDLLGKQPGSLGACPFPPIEDLNDIIKLYGGKLSQIDEFLIHLEQSQGNVLTANVQDTPHNYIPGIYFELPENEQFIAYWDKVKQRLYNIRYSLNIDGIHEQLALFQPPIDPMQLVAAVASGTGIGGYITGSQVDVPYYRFSIMVAKAQTMTQTVMQLGQSLLSVLEKQDGEQLSLLYSNNQQNLLALTSTSKQNQLDAATQTLQSLEASLENAQIRVDHYTRLLDKDLSSGEITQLALETAAIRLQTGAQAIKGASIAAYMIPTIYGFSDGDFKPGDATSQGANILEGIANTCSMAGGLASTIAGYQRRAEDWQLQQDLAQSDVTQIRYQIAGAQYQQSIANQEIKLLKKQIEQEQAVQVFLKNKFTRAQLYQWMTGKLAGLYFQAYQLAYVLSLQAERAWQFEQCKQQSFVNASYWDDLHHGLVAGERLQLDLQRMEKAYMDQDQRKLEIEKIVSLAQLDPKALQDLKTTGTCTFDITEKDFDYDYMGHYCRQIKSISLSFPALLGPYQNIHATLTQTANKTLLQPDIKGVKYLLGFKDAEQPTDDILRIDVRANQQVALSQASNDDGLFIASLDDPRYLPFEGTGAISSWRIDLPKECNPINFDSITDVIMTMRYTASVGGNTLQKAVAGSIGNFQGGISLSMADNYANAWYSFIQQSNPLIFAISPTFFRANLNNYTIVSITLFLILTPEGQKINDMPVLTLTLGDNLKDITFKKDINTGIVKGSVELQFNVNSSAQCQLKVKSDADKLITSENLSNMIINLTYIANFEK